MHGKEPAYPGYYRNVEKKLAREQRKLSRMQKGSNNRNKQRLKAVSYTHLDVYKRQGLCFGWGGKFYLLLEGFGESPEGFGFLWSCFLKD